MSLFCFDLDDTITAYPEVFKTIMSSLKMRGHTVVILTGSMDPVEENKEFRRKQLASLGVGPDHYDNLVIARGDSYDEIGEQKGRFCKDYGAVMHFDDNPIYLKEIERVSPNTVGVKVP